MAQLGSRRRKRNVVESSDDDEDIQTQPPSNALTKFLQSPTKPHSPSSSPTKSATGPIFSQPETTQRPVTRSSRRTLVSSSPTTTPNKKPSQRPSKRLKVDETGRTADIKTLFSNQAQKAKTTAAPVAPVKIDDIFTSSDPISEDDDFADYKASTSSVVGQNARKRQKREGTGAIPAASFAGPFSQSSSSGQIFKKPPIPARAQPPEEDGRPWSERFGPANLDELAVHKRKVTDVRRWLEEVLAGRIRQRLLVLKGAAGSGKTTTVRLLARELGCDVLEWRNPTGRIASEGGQAAGFASFLGAGGRFGALDMDDDDATSQPPPSQAPGAPRQTILLVEEFPNTFTRSSSAMTTFRSTVQEFLAKSTPPLARFGQRPAKSSGPLMPVVMVISETLLTTASASADSFTAHRLLGPDILRHPGAGTIEFNAIAPTLLAKALELVVQKEARKSGRRRTPGPLVLKKLGEIGDIRNAISSLEFLCLKGDHEADWGSKVTFAKSKRGSKNEVSLTRGEQETLELVSQREASLGIFHAVGKVVYNKREETVPRNDTVEALPDHIRHHSRPFRSLVSVDNLIDETGTDTHTFISALHENYALSCEPTGPTDDYSAVDYINNCLEYLSEADLMCPGRDIFFGGNGVGSGFGGRDMGSHVLRQDEMAFQVASRGLLFSLPSPVRRKVPPSARGGGDTHKLFYPTSLKLWRAKEELEGLVDMWSTKMLKGEEQVQRRGIMDGASMFRKSGAGSRPSPLPTPVLITSTQQKNDEPEPGSLVSLGSAARTEMVLERLPYMAHIGRGRSRAGEAVSQIFKLRDLDRVVTFQGIGPPSEDADADDDDNEEIGGAGGPQGDEAWATDRPSEGSSPRKKRGPVGIQARHRTRGDGHDHDEEPTAGLNVRALVISDDDIEDD